VVIYGVAYTKVIKKVKKLEKTVKSNQARRRAKIVVSDDEEDLEDSSKQGRSAKVLADAAKENVHTYTRRRAVSTAGRISTAKESVSTAGALMSVSTSGISQEVNISIHSSVVIKDKGKAKMDKSEPEQTKTKLQQRQKRADCKNNLMKKKGRGLPRCMKKLALSILKNRKTYKLQLNLTEIRREVPELAAGSSKRDAEKELDQGSSKRQKTSENSEPAKESKEKEND
ncbi:hypothetical protein Tco_1543119, partial [Tanacetum coccineum]